LKKNTTLESFSIDDNHLSNEAKENLKKIKKNRTENLKKKTKDLPREPDEPPIEFEFDI